MTPRCFSLALTGAVLAIHAAAAQPCRCPAATPLWPPQAQPAPMPPEAQVAPAPVGPPPSPPVTYAMLPGHWQLRGSRYVWIPPDRRPRRVVDRAVVPNQYVWIWRDGQWVFVPQHDTAPGRE